MKKLSYLVLSLGLSFSLAGAGFAQIIPSVDLNTSGDISVGTQTEVMPDSQGKCPEPYEARTEGGKVICVNTEASTTVNGQVTTQEVEPINGQCPTEYTLSADGQSCTKSGVEVSGELGHQVVGSGQLSGGLTVEMAGGECPTGYLKDVNNEYCLKPTLNIPQNSDLQVVLGSGQIVVAEGVNEVKVNSEAGVKVQAPTVSGASSVAVETGEGSQKVVAEGATNVETRETVQVDKEGIKIGAEQVLLRVMPAAAAVKASAALGGSFDLAELKANSQGATYVFSKGAKAKLFGFIPVTLQTRAELSAEASGEVTLSRSWWAFLAAESEVAAS